ncbi:MAG: hypothetical protein QNJ46_25960 [Leptolyngbyaceae cyanobacterium MO_188.B28]|nr:hypothetical protein [Leptolyngbyaceae cyanobacterium MO_188.B28]
MKRLVRIVWCLLVCTILCQTLLTSILVLGWVYRWVRHRVGQRLFRLSPMAEQTSWQAFAGGIPAITPMRDAPNLFRQQSGIVSPGHPVLKRLHGWLHTGWLNFRVGTAGILATWSLTLFPCVLWMIAWYTGWHISFTKLYEESATGFSLGFSGLLILTVMMLYAPSAQARHAFTGDWRSFFDWRFIRALLCRRPLQLFLLAIGYVIGNVALTTFKASPTFFLTMNPALETLSAIAALEYLDQYFFYTGGIAFLLFLGLRTWAGRIYSDGLMEMWSLSALKPNDFHLQEIQLLESLEVPYGCRYEKPGLVRKILGIPLTVSYRGAMLTLTICVWGVFNFIPFVSEFANYYPVKGFLNQPLVQLPCFRYVPTALEARAAAEKIQKGQEKSYKGRFGARSGHKTG